LSFTYQVFNFHKLPKSSYDHLVGGQGPPAITASISHVSRGTFVMFLQPLAVTT